MCIQATMPPPFSITLLLLAWCVGASHGAGVRLVMLAKGFGAPRTASAGATPLLPPTRPSEHRRVEGAVAKLLSQVSKVFEDLRPTEGVSKDVYVRVARTGTCVHVCMHAGRQAMNGMQPVNPRTHLLIVVWLAPRSIETCWFVGKVNYRSNCGLTGEDAATYYAPLIMEYRYACVCVSLMAVMCSLRRRPPTARH